ncbi:MAG: arginine--tRNA ligase [Euryarchaeota archaeon]|nr:arginine--tRNA ligase [Euryarchaeota archaeon]
MSNPYSTIQAQAKQILFGAFDKLGLKPAEIKFEEPTEESFGELATPICLELAKKLGKAPTVFADELVEQIEIQPDSLIERVNAADPGYINFFVNYPKLAQITLESIHELGSKYGSSDVGKEVILLLEHTSANPDGPLHVGHLRNLVIGDSLARILRAAGYQVEVQYYINDMGRQIALVVWGILNLKAQLTEDKKPDHKIVDVYIEANKRLGQDPTIENQVNELLRKYEANDPKVVEQFKFAVNFCIKGIVQTLTRLGVRHDKFIWESTFVRNGSVQKILEQLGKTAHAKEEAGALILDLAKFGVEKALVLTRGDGTTLYTTRDIAYHFWKFSQANQVVDIVGADHKLPMQQLKLALQILGQQQMPEVIIFEFVSLPFGKMSTRAGRFISVDELVDEAIDRAKKEVEKRRTEALEIFKAKTAEMVGIGAIKYNIVKVAPEKPMVFKWEEALDFERIGAPFIQYAHARACRILEKAKLPKETNYQLLLSSYEKRLVKLLAKYPSVVEEAAQTRKPYLVAIYAQALADEFNKFYRFVPVLKAETPELFSARLALVNCVRQVLANSLDLLGIAAPTEM